MHGGKVGAYGAEDFEAFHGTESARDFLFNFGHPNRLFGDVVGEGDVGIFGETPDIIGVNSES